MKKKIIIAVVSLLLIAVVILLTKETIKENFINSIEYDMKIKKVDTSAGGYASNINYVLVNTKDKIAYRIYNYHVYGTDTPLIAGNHYKITKIKLTDEGIQKLISYSNLPSDTEQGREIIESSKDSFGAVTIHQNNYYLINYNNKETQLKIDYFSDIQTTDLHILFDEDTRKY